MRGRARFGPRAARCRTLFYNSGYKIVTAAGLKWINISHILTFTYVGNRVVVLNSSLQIGVCRPFHAGKGQSFPNIFL